MLRLWLYCISITKKSDIFTDTVIYHTTCMSDYTADQHIELDFNSVGLLVHRNNSPLVDMLHIHII